MPTVLAFMRTCACVVPLWLVFVSGGAFASSTARSCELAGVQVRASLQQDAADACRGAQNAIGFFKAQGLKVDAAVEVHVQDVLPPEVSPSAAGCFLQREGKILLRPYASFRRNRTWFDVAIDRRLYRSLAAHEVAHALASCNFAAASGASIQAKEYVAYVTMFSTMDPGLRARILASHPATGHIDDDRLTALLYMFDPMRFGIEAYRHYARQADSRSYLQKVFMGEALAD